MAMPLRMKRMVRERKNLEKPNEDYFVHFNDDNLFSFYAYVIGPADTLYTHKFVKLRFDIPEKYPLVPPKCTFIQHSGSRIHPNLYVEGKVCLSILGTWPGEKWAWAMTIDTVLITIRSLLDSSPYKHEPNQKDNPNFNQYVQYTGWKSLLLDYVQNERDTAARAFLEQHIGQSGNSLINELQRQATANCGLTQLTSPYGGNRHTMPRVNYEGLLQDVIRLVDQCQTAETSRQALLASPIVEENDKSLNSTDQTAPLRIFGTSQNRPCVSAPIIEYAVTSSGQAMSQKDFLISRNQLATTSVLPPLSDLTASLSPLKRKYEVIDLTCGACEDRAP